MANALNGSASADVEAELKTRLSRCTFEFSTRLASSCSSGALCQIWMPEVTASGEVVLSAQGLPFALAGVGDLLALFRCVSCRYRFSTDPSKPALMGAIGRVFKSCEPEMTNNLQKYDKQVYLRVSEAQRCRVHSTLVMPVFAGRRRERPAAVFELVQSDREIDFQQMMGTLRGCLHSEGLSSYDPSAPGSAGSPAGLEGVDLLGELGDMLGAAPSAGGQPAHSCGGNGVHGGIHGGSRLSPANDAAGGRIGALSGGGPPGAVGAAAADAPANEHSSDSSTAAGGPRTAAGAAPAAQGAKRGIEATGETDVQQPMRQQQQQQQQQLERCGSAGSPAAPAAAAAAPAAPAGVAADATAAAAMAAAAAAASNPQLMMQMFQAMAQQQQQQQPGAANPMLGLMQSFMGQAQQQAQQQQQQQPPPPQPQQPQGASSPQPEQGPASDPQLQAEPAPSGAMGRPSRGGGGRVVRASAVAAAAALKVENGLGDDDDDEDDFDGSDDEGRRGGGAHPSQMGAGRRLSYEDLAAQFGTGLKQAAANLGICPTTLKRACRRNGITRWPRRQIAKLSRTLTQMGYPGEPPTLLVQSTAKGSLDKAITQLAASGMVVQQAGVVNGGMSNSLTLRGASMPIGIPMVHHGQAMGVGGGGSSGVAFISGPLSLEATAAALGPGISGGSSGAANAFGGVGGSVHGGVGGSVHGSTHGACEALAHLQMQAHSFPGAVAHMAPQLNGLPFVALSGPAAFGSAGGAGSMWPRQEMVPSPHGSDGTAAAAAAADAQVRNGQQMSAMFAADAQQQQPQASQSPHDDGVDALMQEMDAPGSLDKFMVDLINEDMLLPDSHLNEGDLELLAALDGPPLTGMEGGGGGSGSGSH